MPQVVNSRMKNTELIRVPMISQMRNLPYLVWVLSTIMPIIGSFMASQIRAAPSSTPAKAALSPSVSVMYSIKNAPTRLQMASLPMAPMPKAYF